MKTVLYHNPRCSKSRAALTLLELRGEKIEIVHYLDTPPSETELAAVLKKLAIPARALIRTKEPLYRKLGLDEPTLSERDLVRALAANPVLIERPIAIRGKRAIIGRPPEKVLELL
ncbi:MAG: arsenate reductase (glutaredoxin) [Pseudomonadota bacterium]